jgi:hypothetical protein
VSLRVQDPTHAKPPQSLSSTTSDPAHPYVLPTLHEQSTGISSTYTAKTHASVSSTAYAHDDDAEPTAEVGWATCLRVMEGHDRTLLKAWNAEIDGLLLLVSIPPYANSSSKLMHPQAGLLSGVVTTFVVQSSTLLTPDPTAPSTAILGQISLQLASLAPNATLPLTTVATAQTFTPTPAAVCVNALWFLSLTLSLLTAVAGLHLRQWLAPRAHGAGAGTSVRERVRVRERTRAAFARWRVPAVVGALPTLLQLSVALFLAGLVLLLWDTNTVVAGVVSVPAAAAAVAMALTVVLPAFAVDCPYRSPASERVEKGVKATRAYIHAFRKHTVLSLPLVSPRTPSFALAENEPAAEDAALDKAALAWTQGAAPDPTLGAALLPCLADVDREGVLTWVAQERGVRVPHLLERLRRDAWRPGGAPPGESLLCAVLAAAADGGDDTPRWGAARMDILGLLAHLLEETRAPSARLARAVLAGLLPVLDVAEVRAHHASRLSEFLYRAVALLVDEHAHVFSARGTLATSTSQTAR